MCHVLKFKPDTSGLDPVIQIAAISPAFPMGYRVKPGNDEMG